MKIESIKAKICSSTEETFKFLSDFNNYRQLMPKEVVDWKSTETECSFAVTGLATIAMKIKQTIPNHEIMITSGENAPFSFTMTCFISPCNENHSEAWLVFEADVNSMMKMMIEKPLTDFFNVLANNLEKKFLSYYSKF